MWVAITSNKCIITWPIRLQGGPACHTHTQGAHICMLMGYNGGEVLAICTSYQVRARF